MTGDTAEEIDYFDVMDYWRLSCVRLRPRPELRPAHDRLPLDRASRRRSSSTCSRWAPPTACSCSSSSEGYGNEIFGFQQVDTIEAWVPLFLFAVLFGLSMDYQVFLLSRIRERYTQSGDTIDAVRFGSRLDGADHHRRRADHRRRLRRLRRR